MCLIFQVCGHCFICTSHTGLHREAIIINCQLRSSKKIFPCRYAMWCYRNHRSVLPSSPPGGPTDKGRKILNLYECTFELIRQQTYSPRSSANPNNRASNTTKPRSSALTLTHLMIINLTLALVEGRMVGYMMLTLTLGP